MRPPPRRQRQPTVALAGRPRSGRPSFDRPALRRAAALYLLSRETLARDVSFLLLPAGAEAPPASGPAAPRRPAAPGSGNGGPRGAGRDARDAPDDPDDPAGRDDRDGRVVPARALRPGAADLVVWLRGRVLLVGFAPPRARPLLAQQRFAASLRALGHEARLIHAETPAHAVEQLAALLEGDAD